VSCSRDGSARLWECGSGQSIASLAEGRSEINCCAVTDLADDLVRLFDDRIPKDQAVEKSKQKCDYKTARSVPCGIESIEL